MPALAVPLLVHSYGAAGRALHTDRRRRLPGVAGVDSASLDDDAARPLGPPPGDDDR
jgi:hypothetical protein